MPVFVGTSGWQYADWRGGFYPDRLPTRRWFEYLLGQFRTVELNVTFYRLPPRTVFEGWRERSPPDAVIAVKASRYLTHVRRLRDPSEPVARLMERVTGLGDKLGPLLVQLPPDLPVDLDGLDATLAAFPAGTRVAVEPRHPSWWVDEARDLLRSHGAASVWADRREADAGPLWRTAGFGYLRFHQGAGRPSPRYRRARLVSWAERVVAAYDEDTDVFAYFNNDPGGAAVADSAAFAAALRRAGRSVSRVPAGRSGSASPPAGQPPQVGDFSGVPTPLKSHTPLGEPD